jgi:hypothetical protein
MGWGMPLIARMFLLLVAAALPVTLDAAPISAAARARLGAGKDLYVVVEFNGAPADAAANAERSRRGLIRDDVAILAQRATGYAASKARVETEAGGVDAVRVLDYSHFPLAVWRLSSPAALNRLESNPAVRMVHENILLHPVSVSDLGFINQPQTAAQGATGAGTTIAVIDGGLASGAVYDSASVGSDQINSAAAAQQFLAFGIPPTNVSDGPVPPWAYVLLALSMGLIARRRLVPAVVRSQR